MGLFNLFRNKEADAILMDARKTKDNREVIAALQEGRLSPDAKLPGDADTLLMRAVYQDDLALTQALLSAGASVRAAGHDGDLPIHSAQSAEMIDLLVAGGADVNAPFKGTDSEWLMRGETALHRNLFRAEHETRALKREDAGSPAAQEARKQAIRRAACVQALLRHGADMDAPMSRKEYDTRLSGAAARVVRQDGDRTLRQRLYNLMAEAPKAIPAALVIEMRTNGAAFQDSDLLAHQEAGRVLDGLADRLAASEQGMGAMLTQGLALEDANGNVIGQARLVPGQVSAEAQSPGMLRLVVDATYGRLVESLRGIAGTLAHDQYERQPGQRADWHVDWDHRELQQSLHRMASAEADSPRLG